MELAKIRIPVSLRPIGSGQNVEGNALDLLNGADWPEEATYLERDQDPMGGYGFDRITSPECSPAQFLQWEASLGPCGCSWSFLRVASSPIVLETTTPSRVRRSLVLPPSGREANVGELGEGSPEAREGCGMVLGAREWLARDLVSWRLSGLIGFDPRG